MADKQHGAWRSGNRYALPTSPHPRRRLLEIRNSCATLTYPTAQKIGHSTPALPNISLEKLVVIPTAKHPASFAAARCLRSSAADPLHREETGSPIRALQLRA